MEKSVQEFMLSLIRAQICTDLSLVPDKKLTDGDIAEMYRFSSKHDLAHVVGASLDALGFLTKDEQKSDFAKAGHHAIFRYANQSSVYETVCALFEKEGIPYLPLKGLLLRDIYPSPELRSACDIDILIPEEKLEEAVSLLVQSLSFERRGKTYHDVSMMLGSVHLELHYNITEDDSRLDRVLSQVWRYTVRDSDSLRMKMTDEFFVFHIVAHMCHHFLYGGCGIKSLMDLWLLRNKTVFDEQRVLSLCRECGIDTFFLAVCELSDVWFSGKEHTELTETMQEYIFSGGVYGSAENEIITQKNEQGGKLNYLMSRIFMPRRHLEMLYPVLKEKPWLLPICHIRRWIRVIRKGRTKKAFDEIAYTAAIPKARNEEIKEMLNTLKL